MFGASFELASVMEFGFNCSASSNTPALGAWVRAEGNRWGAQGRIQGDGESISHQSPLLCGYSYYFVFRSILLHSKLYFLQPPASSRRLLYFTRVIFFRSQDSQTFMNRFSQNFATTRYVLKLIVSYWDVHMCSLRFQGQAPKFSPICGYKFDNLSPTIPECEGNREISIISICG